MHLLLNSEEDLANPNLRQSQTRGIYIWDLSKVMLKMDINTSFDFT